MNIEGFKMCKKFFVVTSAEEKDIGLIIEDTNYSVIDLFYFVIY